MTLDGENTPTLDDLDVLAETLRANWHHGGNPRIWGQMYCPSCGGVRRMVGRKCSDEAHQSNQFASRSRGTETTLRILTESLPILIFLMCSQCDATFTILLYLGPTGISMANFPSGNSGLATPHTPMAVAYYLDQAQKSWSVGANSAAVAMYRAVVEQLLFNQGYTKRMLGNKINDLRSQIEAETAPRWALDLDPRYLEVLKELGDRAIHPNDGDVDRQSVLDGRLLTRVKATVMELLVAIYELDYERSARLASLEAASQAIDEPNP